MRKHVIMRAAVTAAIPLATLGMGGMTPAVAAATSQIQLSAPAGQTLDGLTVSAYRLGAYSDAYDANGDGKIDSVNVASPDDATDAWVTAALQSAGVTPDPNYDAAGNYAKLSEQDGSAATQRAVAKALADADQKPEAAVADKAISGDSATLDLPADGLYLVITSGGKSLPIVASTKIQGADMQDLTLGQVTLKSTAVNVDKKIFDETGKTAKDSDTVTVGETRRFEATFVVPDQSTNPTKLVYTDKATGMEHVDGTVSAKVGETDAKVTGAIKGDTLTVDVSSLIDGNWGKTVTITYQAKVTQKGATNDATLTATLDGNDYKGTDNVPTNSFDFGLLKVKASDKSTLKGAGFKIQDSETGKWLSWDADASAWSFADDEKSASEVTTGDDGRAAFSSLGAGSYLVKETTVPAGMISVVRPSFKVTVSDAGAVSISEESDPNLTDVADGTVTVQNVDSLTQLPQTGEFMNRALLLASLCVLAGGSLVGITVVRRIKSDAQTR